VAPSRLTASLRATATRAWLPVLIIVLWQWSVSGSSNPFFPPPLAILESLAVLAEGRFWTRTMIPTLTLLGFGYSVGATAGIVLGTLIGASEGIRRVFTPIGVFMRSVPTAAKLPVILAAVGIGSTSLYLAVSLAVFFNVLVVTIIGVSRVSPQLTDAAKILGVRGSALTWRVKFPAATGDILLGLQSALQGAILVTILVETLASGFGVGSFLQEAQSLFRLPQMWAAIVILGVIGMSFNELFNTLERRVVPWYFATRGGE